MKAIFSFIVGLICTLIFAYFIFVSPEKPPNYVYVLIFLVFYSLTYGFITWIKGRRSHHESTNQHQP